VIARRIEIKQSYFQAGSGGRDFTALELAELDYSFQSVTLPE